MDIKRRLACVAVAIGGTGTLMGVGAVPAFAACAGSWVGRVGSIPSGSVVAVDGHLYGCHGSSWIVL